MEDESVECTRMEHICLMTSSWPLNYSHSNRWMIGHGDVMEACDFEIDYQHCLWDIVAYDLLMMDCVDLM